MSPAAKRVKLSNGAAAVVDEVAEEPALVPDTKPSAAKDDKAVEQRRSLFVRALPPTATSETLTSLFSESYPIKHAIAVTDPATKTCRGYGFVTFADAEDAQRAKQEFNGRTFEGRKLRVEIAEPRQREGEGEAAGKKKVHEREQQAPPKLIVRNLPWSIKGSHQLEKLFQSYGKIKQAYVPSKGPGLMAGFGFVLMRGRKNAERAMEGINGKEVDGRTLAVDWAVDKDTFRAANGAEGDAEESSAKGEDDDSDEFGRDAVAEDDEEEEEDEDMDGEDNDDDDADSGDDAMSDDEGVDVHINGQPEDEARQEDDRSTTLFVRNLPFTCTDEDLEDHFTQFGSVRYARVVMDHGTDRSKGTGFVCFYNVDDTNACLRDAPRRTLPTATEKSKDVQGAQPSQSILQNDEADPSGRYTLDGRVVQLSRAVNKSEASRLTAEGSMYRNKRDTDKRRLYLLSEGTIASNSKLWEKLSPSERTMREASAKQRKTLIENNPSLNLSLTRLSVRNLPRSVGSKELKALARDAVVGFATDVKGGVRQKLTREELARGADDMIAAEAARKKSGKGIVKQAKVVFEGAGGSKVSEDTGAGRSRGYGFIEYHTHRSALMGLRWLNGHAVGYQVSESGGKRAKPRPEDVQDRKKRLIVEFAIENAQVVLRRNDREQKARDRSRAVQDGDAVSLGPRRGPPRTAGKPHPGALRVAKRKRGPSDAVRPAKDQSEAKGNGKPAKTAVDEKTAKRNQIIGRKRAMRKNRKGGK